MTVFWIIAVLLAIAGGVLLALPLWRRATGSTPTYAQVNLTVLRDQLKEMDADLAAGALTQAQYATAREELEGRVAGEVIESRAEHGDATSSRVMAGVLMLIVPLAALGLYGLMGNPKAIGVQKRSAGDISSMTPEHFTQMTAKLAAKLEKNPNDPTGWLMLGKAYKALERFKEAAQALGKAAELKPDDPDVLTEYAEALALEQGGSFVGQPEQMLNRVLKMAPEHARGLTMAGAVAFERKNYSGAITHWQKLLRLVKDDTELQKALLAGIAEASRLRTVASTPAQGVMGRVQLDAALADQVDPADTVFVFARAADGPGMPVAALRKQVRDLPFTFRLDDTFALNPSVRLSSLSGIVVGARISKSGDAMPKPGDLRSGNVTAKLGANGIVLNIKEVVP